ncbi:hypothetical protein ISS37_05930 [candidate division KSB1 bacterium]|nr:hypothetical protein [candidate division KSB1 bacterium]
MIAPTRFWQFMDRFALPNKRYHYTGNIFVLPEKEFVKALQERGFSSQIYRYVLPEIKKWDEGTRKENREFMRERYKDNPIAKDFWEKGFEKEYAKVLMKIYEREWKYKRGYRG